MLLALCGCRHEQVITVVFRCDDYGHDSPSRVAARVDAIFREGKIPLVLGVVPFRHGSASDAVGHMNPWKIELLRKGVKDGVYEVAQHGFNHSHRSPIERKSEFKGVPYDEQLALIRHGSDYLREISGADIVAFVPPWHSYDQVTLKAIRATGIPCISAIPVGSDTLSVTDPELLKLAAIPTTCGLVRLRSFVKAAQESGDPAPVIVVLFHDYDFKGKWGKTVNEEFFRKLFHDLRQNASVHISGLVEVQKKYPDRTIGFMLEAQDFRNRLKQHQGRLWRWLHIDLDRLLPIKVTYSPAHIRSVKRTIIWHAGVAVLIGLTLMILLVWLLLMLYRSRAKA